MANNLDLVKSIYAEQGLDKYQADSSGYEAWANALDSGTLNADNIRSSISSAATQFLAENPNAPTYDTPVYAPTPAAASDLDPFSSQSAKDYFYNGGAGNSPVTQPDNSTFNTDLYNANQADYMNNMSAIEQQKYIDKYGTGTVGGWTANDIAAAQAHDGVTAFQDYTDYGQARGVNPWETTAKQAPTPTYTPAPPIAAPTYEIDPATMTVEGRLEGLLDPSNPLMQRAATQGMQYANSRGLLNSSIAVEAAQNAMIDQGIKIAGPDAETYFKQQGLNQDYTFRYDELGEKTREFDVGADQWQQNFNEGIRQYGLDFGENSQEFNEGLNLRYDEMDNDNKKAFIGVVGDARNNFDAYVSSLMVDPDLSADDIQGLTDTAFTSTQSFIDLAAAFLGTDTDISWAPNDDVSIPQGTGDINYAEATQGLAAKGWVSTDIARYLQGEGLTRQQALDALGNDPASVAAVNAVYGEF